MRKLMLILIAVVSSNSLAYAETNITIRGRVLDALGVAADGATIKATCGDSTASCIASGDGRFSITIPLPDDEEHNDVVLHATFKRGDLTLHGHHAFRLEPEAISHTREVLMTVAELEAVRVLVRSKSGPVPGVRCELFTAYTNFSHGGFASNENGHVEAPLSPGDYWLVVSDPRYARAYVHIRSPSRVVEGSLDALEAKHGGMQTPTIHAVPARNVSVQVVDKSTGAPVEGAFVALGDQDSGRGVPFFDSFQTTDAEGLAVIPRVSQVDPVQLRAGSTRPLASGKIVVFPYQERVVLQLEREKLHRTKWPVAKNAYAPPDGSTVTFLPSHSKRRTGCEMQKQSGYLVLEDWPDDFPYGYAVLENRVAAHLSCELDHVPRDKDSPRVEEPSDFPSLVDPNLVAVTRPEIATFLAKSTVHLRLEDENGEPVPGEVLSLSGQFLGEDRAGELRHQGAMSVTTDAAGEATVAGVFFRPTSVSLAASFEQLGYKNMGTIDPKPGTTTEHTLVAPSVRGRVIELRITMDGEPGIPRGMEISACPRSLWKDVDPVAGTLRIPCSVQPQTYGTTLFVSAPGYVSWWSDKLDIEALPTSIDVALKTELVVSAVCDDPKVPHDEVVLYHFDPSVGGWRNTYALRTFGRAGISAMLALQRAGIPCWRVAMSCAPGKYRFVYMPTESVMNEFSIDRSKRIWVAHFSVPKTVTVKGTLVSAIDIPWQAGWIEREEARSTILEDDDSINYDRPRADVSAEGEFEVTLAEGEKSAFILNHPLVRSRPFALSSVAKTPAQVHVDVKPHVLVQCLYPKGVLGDKCLPQLRGEVGMFTSMRHQSWTAGRHRGRVAKQDSAPTVYERVPETSAVPRWKRITRATRLKGAVAGHQEWIYVPFERGGAKSLWIDPRIVAPFQLNGLRVPSQGRTSVQVRMQPGSSIVVRVRPSKDSPMKSATASLEPRDPLTSAVQGRASGHLGADRQVTPFARGGMVMNDVSLSGKGGVADGDEIRVTAIPKGTYRLRIEAQRRLGARFGAPQHIELPVTVDGKSTITLTADFRTPAEIEAEKKAKAKRALAK